MGYRKTVIKGFIWMSSFRAITRLFSFVRIFVLAHVLSPQQFGIFAVASLIWALLDLLTETGINIILIQVKDLEEYLSIAWIVSIIRGISICILLILLSPLIAVFFKSQQSIPLILLISLVPLLRGFINPATIRFQKSLQFHYEFWFRLVIFIFDASVTIVLSLITHSVFSLVWGLLAGAFLEIVLSFLFITPKPAFIFDFAQFKNLIHRTKWITMYGILNYISEKGDNFVVGNIMGTTALGLYEMAYKISFIPITEVAEVISRVVFPTYAKIGTDRKRLLSAFIRTAIFVEITTLCIGLFIFLYADQIISIGFGNKWLPIIPVLKVLSFYGIIRSISGPASALFLAVEKQKYVTGMNLIRSVGLVITIYPLVKMFGLIGAGYSAIISVLLEIPLIIFYIIRVFKNF